MKYELLRKKYPQFIYESFSWKVEGKALRIFFDFRVPPDIRFFPELLVENIDPVRLKKLEWGIVDNLVFNLGLIESLSYWKATASPEILVRAGSLSEKQVSWWQDLFRAGLGQYFFENKIDFRSRGFLEISFPFKSRSFRPPHLDLKKRFLVPLGGGKDSILTLELLKGNRKKIRCFSLNPNSTTEKILNLAGAAESVVVQRQIDPRLLELNHQGFLNGHTPFSAYLAFLSVLSAVLFDCQDVAFSNERSANEGNVKYLGQEINHQYSKSFVFEKKFREYCQQHLVRGVTYFSFLRPLYELQIARLFSRYPKYFKAFLSCNQARATQSGTRMPSGKWCRRCSKCLFVFACLYPFLGEKKTAEIFGEDLFEKKELLPVLQELIGEKSFKPFECVGTREESLAALYLSLEKKRCQKPYLLNYFAKEILPKYPNLRAESRRVLGSWNSQNNLPPEMKSLLKHKLYNET
ncbi:MAG: hypothetical protein HY577_01195 [Candidatus Nealsonbacteria bacterium]|nr:hypothetical protein [Candidatus Nealsonbacteria bacterium]